MAFWIAAAGIALAVTALLVLALLRGAQGAEAAGTQDLRVYRDQLREIDRDMARGTVTGDEAARLRTEISRRILEADRAMQGAGAPGEAPRQATLAAAGLIAIVLVGAVWTYLRIGAPGYPDMPIAERLAMADEAYRTRPSQAEAQAAAALRVGPAPAADASFIALMTKLRTALKDRPDDLDGHLLLARNEAALGNFAAAIAAQQRVIAIKGPQVQAQDHASLAEVMILAAGGFVSAAAEAELVQALRLDPLDGTAGYYAGLMFAQVGRPDRAFSLWAPLLQRSNPDDPWVAPIRAQIEQVASEAGVAYTLPDAAPGPDQAAVAAAADMTPEARQQMITGMVAQLSDRLATQGGTAEEWARLIGAYGVLGDAGRAKDIWAEAQARFADKPGDLAQIRAAAVTAGVAE